MKVTALIAAFEAFLTSSIANAKIIGGGESGQDDELFFNIWSDNKPVSLDLNIHFSTVEANIGSDQYNLTFNSVALDVALNSVFAEDYTSAQWNIVAGSNTGIGVANSGFLTTTLGIPTPNDNVGIFTGNIDAFAAKLDNNALHINGNTGPVYIAASNVDADYAGQIGFANFSLSNTAAVDTEMSMFHLGFQGFDPTRFISILGSVIRSVGKWLCDAKSLIDTSVVSVPAVVWRLASSLIGVGAVSRCRLF